MKKTAGRDRSMPKSDNQKLKIFYILDYLQRYSHQAHPVRQGPKLRNR